MTDTDLREENWKKEFWKLRGQTADYRGWVPVQIAEDFIEQLILKEREKEREKVIEEVLEELEDYEIRNDDGSDYVTDDTEFMRKELIEAIKSLQLVAEDGKK